MPWATPRATQGVALWLALGTAHWTAQRTVLSADLWAAQSATHGSVRRVVLSAARGIVHWIVAGSALWIAE